MATIKSFTSLEQSRKLAKILPIESADMFYKAGNDTQPTFRLHSYGHIMSDKDVCAWSLAALLEIIKKLVGYSLQSLDTHTVFMNCELGDKPYNIETENYDNPVDACYEMIIKLSELNLL